MTRISDMTALSLTSPTGVFAPVEKTGSTTNYRVDLAAMSSVTPQLFGAVADGVTDDSAAFVAAILYLRGFALNTGGGGFYKGSPSLFIPAGHYYLGTTAIDINHTVLIEGEGSGNQSPGAGGCSRLRWAAGANGLRVQGPNTNGNIGVDTDPNTHDGAGGVYIKHLCLEGGLSGNNEGDFHGLVLRNPTVCEDLNIKNWQGEGVKARAGNQNTGGTLGGNVSGSRFINVTSQSNRIGFDTGGADANVITFIDCNAYQNRQVGFLDDNGAGANTYIGCHTASNGVITGTWPQTQCSDGTYRYAAKFGGDPTVAPSAGVDSANWLMIEAGAAVAGLIPAWVNTPNTFRVGGDYLTINSAGVILVNCYSEYGGFNQFNNTTLIEHGTIGIQYFRGGSRIVAGSGGLDAFVPNTLNFNLRTRSGEVGIYALDENATQFGYVDFVKGNSTFINGATGVILRKSGTNIVIADDTQFNLASGVVFKVNGTTAIDGSRNATLASIASTGVVSSSSASAGVGYATGAGGTVTQATSKSTGVTLNKVSGQVTMNGAALASAAKVSFVVTNSTVAATDMVIPNVVSGGTANAYRAAVTAVAAGSFTVTVENITGGSLSEAPVIGFAVIKAVAA